MHCHNYRFFFWESLLFFAHSIPLKWKLIEVGNSTEYLPCGMKYRLLLLLLSENTRMYQVPGEGWIRIKKTIFCLKTNKQNHTPNYLVTFLKAGILIHIPISVYPFPSVCTLWMAQFDKFYPYKYYRFHGAVCVSRCDSTGPLLDSNEFAWRRMVMFVPVGNCHFAM